MFYNTEGFNLTLVSENLTKRIRNIILQLKINVLSI